MKHNEIMKKTTRHGENSDGSRKFIFFAALAAAIAAIAGALYGVFRLGKKRGAEEEAERSKEKLRAERAKRRAEARRMQRAAAQPVYVVHPLQPKKRESGAKRFRRHLCAAVAAILVISMVGSSTMPYIEPSTVLAKESFSGIGKIVEEHEDEPYRILDIVASDGTYTDGSGKTYTFNLGTMGYLVNGQSDLQADLARIFKEDLAAATYSFGTFDARETLFNSVTGSTPPLGLTYEEAYGGVEGMSTAGYTLIYDPSPAATISEPAGGSGGFAPLVETGPVEPDNEPAGDPADEPIDNGTGEGDNGGNTTGTPEGEDNGGNTTGTPEEENNGGGNTYGLSNMLPGNSNTMLIDSSDDTVITGKSFLGRYEEVSDSTGDYTEATGTSGYSLLGRWIAPVPTQTYVYGEIGAPLHVTFKPAGPATGETGGYVVNVLGLMSEGGQRGSYATDLSGVYYYHADDGTYTYAGTVAQILGRSYVYSGGSQENGEQEEKKEGEEKKEEEQEEQEGQNTQTGEVIPPAEGGDPTQDGTGGDNTESGGDNTETGGNPSGGETAPSGGEGTPSGGETTPSGGEGTPSGGETTPSGGEPTTPPTNNNEEGGGTPPAEPSPTEPTTPPAEPSPSPTESSGENLTSRARLPQDNWYLLVDEGLGGGSGDPDTSDGDPNTGGDPDMNNNDPGTGSGDSDTENNDSNTGGGDGSNSNSTGSYVMVGTPDEEIDWANPAYENLMICSFSYVENPEVGTMLYEVDSVEEVVNAPGLPLPYDAYSAGESSGIGPMSAQGGSPIAQLNGDDGIGLIDLPTPSETKTFIYTPGTGTHKLIYDPKNGTTNITIQGAPIYIRCSTNDWLKQYVFSSLSGGDNADSDFQIEVVTMRADDVDPSDVLAADLIFLEDGKNNPALAGLTAKYIGDSSGTSTGGATSGYDTDMKSDVMQRILLDAAEDLKPVIVEYGITTDEDNYQNSVFQHLAQALLKRDLASFCEKMSEKGNFAENVAMNLDSDDFPDKKDNEYDYVNQNVYVVNSSNSLVNADFPDQLDDSKAKAGFYEVLSAIRAENTTLSEDDRIAEWVSKARAVQYIINFSVGILGDFSDLAILEIQPSANLKSDFTLEDGNTKLLWKKDGMRTAKQILFSKNKIRAQIDTKAVVEFNSEWQDINGVYDMVFIGLDGQRLNRNGDRETLYNKDELNGKLYHTGDESGVGLYDANDLTTQKMDALLHYMAAGYPVLVENDFFKEGTAKDADSGDIDTDYIQEDSVMYKFLTAAVEGDEYEDCIFTVADAMANSMFMTRVRLDKPRIALVDEDGEETSKVQFLSRNENDEYHGQIYYRITDNHGDVYGGDAVVNVYADYNHDGYFTPAEQVTEYINQDNMLDVEIDGMGPGILPWKIEVSDVGNEYRRASVQGYFELGSETADELKVLQITEKKGDALYDLQQIYNKKDDSVLAFYLKGAEPILNVEWQFESVNAAQLEEKLADNANYLAQWDVVVLTLDDAAGSEAVTDAVNRYVDEGRSLLVCGQDPGDQRAGLSASLLGQTESKTFVNLGANGASGYKRYEGLKADMYGGQTLLKAEPVNEGSISLYPYTIDGRFTFGERGLLKAAPYLLDFEDNLSSEENAAYVTPWYTFGSDDRNGTAYGISPKDGRNNYYCYSKGNIVYLAQSEYPYTCDETTGPEAGGEGTDESRFFVNALMAAYSAGLHNAHINIVAGFSPDAADIASISVPFDETWLETNDSSGGILGNTVDVYFKFRDSNLAPEKTSVIGFYYEDPSAGEVDLGTQKVNATPFASEIWTVTDNRLVKVGEGEELQPGKIYRIKAPVVALRDSASLTRDESKQEEANKADIYIVLQTSFTRSGRNYQIISADAVSLNRTRLFLLE